MLAIAYDPATNPLNNNEWAFPLAECIHISMFAMSVGTIALVDLRLLGWAFRKQAAVQLLEDTEPWTLAGLTMVIMSGLIIWSSDPVRYYYSWPFRYKMGALVFAILYNYTIHRTIARTTVLPSAGSILTAALSLAIWISIVFAGLFYSFT